ncbi:hypothetical protein E2C01_085809 [Portunus trituberculatus]|uniref:Secreted protein n=1 Tax=Portunus trituberculatus TaxID=210409 RepID=A0A5B7JCX7_PORTR|nr:hypothetical protein [Portunus trituberculatus]
MVVKCWCLRFWCWCWAQLKPPRRSVERMIRASGRAGLYFPSRHGGALLHATAAQMRAALCSHDEW